MHITPLPTGEGQGVGLYGVYRGCCFLSLYSTVSVASSKSLYLVN